jgi:hypothetical protein
MVSTSRPSGRSDITRGVTPHARRAACTWLRAMIAAPAVIWVVGATHARGLPDDLIAPDPDYYVQVALGLAFVATLVAALRPDRRGLRRRELVASARRCAPRPGSAARGPPDRALT